MSAWASLLCFFSFCVKVLKAFELGLLMPFLPCTVQIKRNDEHLDHQSQPGENQVPSFYPFIEGQSHGLLFTTEK